ncbi:MAG: winged helix-turn-helix transcriptional regulator [Halanaerobiales bacterium]
MKKLLLLIEIEKTPNISQKELAKKIHVTVGQANNYIRELEEAKLLVSEAVNNKKKKYLITEIGKKEKWHLIKKFFQEKKQLTNLMEELIVEKQLNVAIIDSIGAVIPDIAQEIGLLPNYNIVVDKFISGKQLFDCMINKYHFAIVGSVPAFLKVAIGFPIDIIAEVSTGGHLLISKNTIQNLKQLEGKKIYIPASSSLTENLFVNMIETKVDNIPFVIKEDRELLKKALDDDFDKSREALILWEPYASMFLSKNNEYEVLYDFSQNPGENKYISSVLVKNNELLSGEVTIETEFIDAIKKTVEFYNNNPDRVSNILTRIFDVPESIINNALQRSKFRYKAF